MEIQAIKYSVKKIKSYIEGIHIFCNNLFFYLDIDPI